MEEIKVFKLMDGDFKISEAQNIILNFYGEKIKFHNRQLLNMKLKNDDQTNLIELKLSQLIKDRDGVIDFLNKHTSTNSIVKVKSEIELTFDTQTINATA